MAIRTLTIKLTDKQRSMLRNLTGEDHPEIRFETDHVPAGPLASKTALRSRSAMAKKLAARKAMARKSALRLAGNHNQVAIRRS